MDVISCALLDIHRCQTSINHMVMRYIVMICLAYENRAAAWLSVQTIENRDSETDLLFSKVQILSPVKTVLKDLTQKGLT